MVVLGFGAGVMTNVGQMLCAVGVSNGAEPHSTGFIESSILPPFPKMHWEKHIL